MALPPDAVRVNKPTKSKLPPDAQRVGKSGLPHDAVRVSPTNMRSSDVVDGMTEAITKGFTPSTEPSPYGLLAPHMRAVEGMYQAVKKPAMQMLKPLTDRAPKNESMNQFFQKRIGFSPLSVAGKSKTPIGFLVGEAGKASQRQVAELMASMGIDLGTGAATDLGTSRVLPAIGKNIVRPLANTAESLGGRFINNLIKPRAAGYRFGANPGRAVAKHIGPKMSQESLLEDVISTRKRLIGDLENMAARSKSPVDATPIFEEIQSAYSKLSQMPETFSSQKAAHTELARDIKNLIVQNGGFIRGNRIYIDPKNAIKVKRLIGELPSWNTLDPKLGSITKTARKMYGRFDKEIDKAIPGSKEINQDVSDLIGAEQGIKLGTQREQNKDPLKSLSDMLLTGIGAAHGGAPGAALGYGASRVLRSTPFNTTVGAVGGQVAKGGKAVAGTLEATRGPGLIESILKKLLGPEEVRVTPDFGPEGLPSGSPSPKRLPSGSPDTKRLTRPQDFEMVNPVESNVRVMGRNRQITGRPEPKQLPKPQGFEMMSPEQADEITRLRGLAEFESKGRAVGPTPKWLREEYAKSNLRTKDTPFVEADLQNQSVRDAIASDPTISKELKERLLGPSEKPSQLIIPESFGKVRKAVAPKERFNDSELMKSVRDILKRFEKRTKGKN